MFIALVAAASLSQPIEAPAYMFEAAPATVTDPLWAQPNFSFSAAQDDEKKQADFSYTYIEIGATQLSPDDTSVTDEDVDSYYGRASLGIGIFHLFGSYENQALDFMDTSTDLYKLGVGLHFPIMRKLDILAEGAWLYSDVSSDISNLDDTTEGFEGRAGLRWMPLLWNGGGVELDGNIVYIDLPNRLASEEESTGWEAGGRVHFLRLFSVGAMYGIIEEDDYVSINARVSF